MNTTTRRLAKMPWLQPVERDHHQDARSFRRRQIVTAATMVITGTARRVKGGVQSPMIIQLIWTSETIVVLPPLTRWAGAEWARLTDRLIQEATV
ncbi:hypothetical protein [Calidifontibacter terrae]